MSYVTLYLIPRYRKIPGDVCNEQGGFHPTSRFINLTEVCTERIKVPTPSPEELEVRFCRQYLNVAILGIVVACELLTRLQS